MHFETERPKLTMMPDDVNPADLTPIDPKPADLIEHIDPSRFPISEKPINYYGITISSTSARQCELLTARCREVDVAGPRADILRNLFAMMHQLYYHEDTTPQVKVILIKMFGDYAGVCSLAKQFSAQNIKDGEREKLSEMLVKARMRLVKGA